MKILNASFLGYLLVMAALFTSPLQIRAANSTTASGQSGDSSWHENASAVEDSGVVIVLAAGEDSVDSAGEDFAAAAGSGVDGNN